MILNTTTWFLDGNSLLQRVSPKNRAASGHFLKEDYVCVLSSQFGSERLLGRTVIKN